MKSASREEVAIGVADGETNRRRHVRVRLPLEAHWEGQAGKQEARVYDLSLGGCYIESIARVTDGERVVFHVKTPRGRWLVLHGEIVHHDELTGFGVRFLPLAPPTERQLAEIIRAAGGEV